MNEKKKEQLKEINKKVIDILSLADCLDEFKFLTREQKIEIIQGEEEGFRVELFCCNEYTPSTMRNIKKFLRQYGYRREGADMDLHSKDPCVPSVEFFNEFENKGYTSEDIMYIHQFKFFNYDIEPFRSKFFDFYKMKVILKSLKEGKSVGLILDPELEPEQMEQIVLGNGLENQVSYVDKNFHWHQMKEIRLGLEKGVDVSCGAKPEIGADLMEIYGFGMWKKGIDVSLYVSPKGVDYQLNEIFIGLSEKLDASFYAAYHNPSGLMRELREKLKEVSLTKREFQRGKSINMIEIDDRFDEEQTKVLQYGKISGVDINMYLNPNLEITQMEEIRKGMENGLNVSVYADEKFSCLQMSCIREALEKKLDVSRLLDANLTSEQMRKIYIEELQRKEYQRKQENKKNLKFNFLFNFLKG